ncbi:hypothetical protein [Methanobrevibacter sp. UBA212]|uniref:hypothetical protein n=1 Tax=Methanobrevibacter sp. UBA212 TaxID=1915476 RepID=UPI0025E1CD23|nr:hypothetical protein [Methanobrevibacter sp. UBA212]MEE1149730.1 hypothetical protein [Methanobrevibacter sp.]
MNLNNIKEDKIMQQNYSQRLEMQIPQENTYTGLTKTKNMDKELANLSKDYNILKIDELKEYLEKNGGLIPYIHSITPLIKDYFPKNELCLTYYIDPEFEELNHALICVIGKNSLFEKERELMNQLNDKLLYLTDFSTDVKSLISVRLWWL